MSKMQHSKTIQSPLVTVGGSTRRSGVSRQPFTEEGYSVLHTLFAPWEKKTRPRRNHTRSNYVVSHL